MIVGGWVRFLAAGGLPPRVSQGGGVPTEVSFVAVAAPVSVEATSRAAGAPGEDGSAALFPDLFLDPQP